jgi:hypothetical protein
MRETALRLAVEEENRRKTDPNETHERSIIILGSKGVVSDEIINVLRFRDVLHYIFNCTSRVKQQ